MKSNASRVLATGLFVALLASLSSAQVFINEYCNDPFRNSTAVGIDCNLDGTAATSLAQADDEFIEIVNLGPATVNIGGWQINDGFGPRHVFAAGTLLPVNGAIVVFGGPSMVMFPNALAAFNAQGVGSGVVATTGTLGLNNTGDSITLFDAMSMIVDTYTFGNQSSPDNGDGESVTRNPETPGSPFGRHSVITAGVLHSAGLHNDGFAGWAPAVIPPPAPPTYPGNGTDADIQFRINGAPQNAVSNVYSTMANDTISMTCFSPAGTLTNVSFILAYDVFITGNPPAPILLPGDPAASVWITPITGRILLESFTTFAQPLSPVFGNFGYTATGQIPVSLGGLGISLMIQLLTSDAGINPVNIGTADAHELVIS